MFQDAAECREFNLPAKLRQSAWGDPWSLWQKWEFESRKWEFRNQQSPQILWCASGAAWLSSSAQQCRLLVPQRQDLSHLIPSHISSPWSSSSQVKPPNCCLQVQKGCKPPDFSVMLQTQLSLRLCLNPITVFHSSGISELNFLHLSLSLYVSRSVPSAEVDGRIPGMWSFEN